MIKKCMVRYSLILIIIVVLSVVLNPIWILGEDNQPFQNSAALKGAEQSQAKDSRGRAMPFPVLIQGQGQNETVSGSLLVDLKFTAAEEPWARFFLSASQWQWDVRRPGDYSAKSVSGEVTGNVDIMIEFSGFADLGCSDANGQTIEAYYGAFIGDKTVEQVIWSRASDFNGQLIPIPTSPVIPIPWSLWNKISVTSRATANDYSDDAVITFGMINLTTWSDPEIPPGQ